jgi:PAS domain S-box-containing protein
MHLSVFLAEVILLNWFIASLLFLCGLGLGSLLVIFIKIKNKKLSQFTPTINDSECNQMNEVLDLIEGYIWKGIANQGIFNPEFISETINMVTQRPVSFFTQWSKSRLELVHPDDKLKFSNTESALLKGELNFSEHEYRIVLNDHSIKWLFERVTVRNMQGSGLLISGVTIDITKKKLSEEKLTDSSDFLLASINSLAQPLFIKDEESRLVLVNDAFSSLFKFEPEELSGKTDFDLFPIEEATSFRNSDLMVLSGASDFYESKVDLKDQKATYHISKTLYHSDSNQKKYIIGLMNDISQRKESEDKLRQAVIEAQGMTKNKSFFLANMSHEIRTPMNAILGMAELLSETDLDPEQKEFIQVINSAGGNLLNLINDILDFSKIEAGFLKFENEAIEITELVSEVIRMFEFRISQKDLILGTRFPQLPIMDVIADPQRLRQVIINLLNNAVKYTPKGHIDIILEILQETSDMYNFKISIADTGLGIPVSEQNRIFEAFKQSSITEGKGFGGTGLGLAISRSIVEMMGGSIGFESTEHKGSEFWFTVKLGKAPVKESNPNDGDETSVTSDAIDINILIADDNPTNLALMGSYLKRFGLGRVTQVTNGQMAVNAVKTNRFDLILMDIQMPVMDGIEAARHIREFEKQDKERKPVTIIAVTAYSLSTDLNKFLNAGMDGFLRKPFKSDELQAAIENALNIRFP